MGEWRCARANDGGGVSFLYLCAHQKWLHRGVCVQYKVYARISYGTFCLPPPGKISLEIAEERVVNGGR
jgi:hypothetical protein